MSISDFVGKAVIVAAIGCVASVAVTVGALAMPAARAKLGVVQLSAQGYAVGGQIDVPPAVYRESRQTVLLFADWNCGVCSRQQPWLAELGSEIRRQGDVRLVMVTKETDTTEELRYAAGLGITQGDVVPLDLRTLRVRRVPTLVVVDRKGVVEYAEDGVPSDTAGRASVIEAMKSLMQTR